jgi:hypothetical protein
MWEWSKILIRGLREVLEFFNLVESSQAKRAGRVRERVDELTEAFKALNKVQKGKILKDVQNLNKQFKAGEISIQLYSKELGKLILNAQTGTTEITELTKGVKKLNDEMDRLGKSAREDELARGGRQFGDVGDFAGLGSIIPDAKQIDVAVVGFMNEMEMSVQKNSIPFNQRLKNFFKGVFGSETFLGGLFGGGKKGEQTAEIVRESFARLLESIEQTTEQGLERLNQLIDRQQDAIENTTELLESEKDRITTLQAAGAAFDTEKKRSLEQQLAAEKQQKDKLLAEEKRYREKQKRLQIVSASIDVAQAVIKALGSSFPPLNFIQAAIVSAFGIAQIASMKNAKFAKGTNYLDLNGNPDGTDTIPIWADKGERIVPRKDNLKIPRTFPNSLLPAAVSYYLDSKSGTPIINTYDSDILNNIEKNTRKDGIVRNPMTGKITSINTNNMSIKYG